MLCYHRRFEIFVLRRQNFADRTGSRFGSRASRISPRRPSPVPRVQRLRAVNDSDIEPSDDEAANPAPRRRRNFERVL